MMVNTRTEGEDEIYNQNMMQSHGLDIFFCIMGDDMSNMNTALREVVIFRKKNYNHICYRYHTKYCIDSNEKNKETSLPNEEELSKDTKKQ